jgi:sulfite reductase (NADPH) flavoprotein alpha-component
MSSPAALLNSPLTDERSALLGRLTEGLDSAGLWWLSGYAAGLAQRGALPTLTAVPTVASAESLTIVYGSQTGNSKRLAEKLAQQAEAAGLSTRLLRADAYPLRELKNERHLQIVISTQGDGDPPDDARGFVEFLLGKRAPRLPELKFAVLGLGDSSYPKFNEIGRVLDGRLAELGATRWLARGEADLDLETVATPWIEQAVALARESLKSNTPLATVTPLRPLVSAVSWSREHPFAAELLVNQRITGRGSDKDIRHLEISLEGSGLTYEPGDALGVWPHNDSTLVEAVLATLALNGDEIVAHQDQKLPLRTWLSEKRELTRVGRPFLETAQPGDQLLDVLRRQRGDWHAESLVTALRPLTPRLYSIASSQKTVGEEAHLTVAHVEYAHAQETRWGAASHFLAANGESARLPVYIERNERFRLPKDSSRDLIMIGPGTGVAPFRGFIQERVAVGASGRHWLAFGNPHGRSDFLYQLEWQRALKQGHLHRLDLAFSRDLAHKVYVQDRLRERGRELYSWLESGAHLYVCGAIAMAKDVHATLIEVIAAHGGKSADDAEDYLNGLQQQGRYARDIY